MYKIVEREVLAPNIIHIKIEAPEIAKVAKPGQFLILRTDEKGERFPMSLADWDREKGTVDIVFIVLGTSTMKLASLKKEDTILDLSGPLGNPADVKYYGNVLVACGCFGIGPSVKLAQALKEKGNRITSVMEARNSSYLFWEERLRKVSDGFYVTVGDGSYRKRGWAEDFIAEYLSAGNKVDVIFAAGCPFMMKQCSKASEPFGVKTNVFLTGIMVDGTGMCGACRVTVGGKTKFACVDGPMFDAHKVDWENLATRLSSYISEEKVSLNFWERENWHRAIDVSFDFPSSIPR